MQVKLTSSPAVYGKSRHCAWVVGYKPSGASRGGPVGVFLEAVLGPLGDSFGASWGPGPPGASCAPLGAFWVADCNVARIECHSKVTSTYT
eukprot:9183502-Pyramimonas_sp.AAC.1